MKKILLLSLLCLSSVSNTFAIDFIVLFSKGNITQLKTGKILKRGLRLTDKDQLSFSSKEDLAVLMSPSVGRTVIKAEIAKSDKHGEFVNYISDVMNHHQDNKTSTRAYTPQVSCNSVQDLRTLLNQKRHVILQQRSIIVEIPTYDAEKGQFYLQYIYNNEKINKALSYTDHLLVLDKKKILSIDGKAIDEKQLKNVTLFFYHKKTKTSDELSSFQLVFPKEEDLLEEAKIVYKYTKSKKKKGVATAHHLSETYGDLDKKELDRVIETCKKQ